MDLSETFGKKFENEYSFLLFKCDILKSGKEEEQNCLEYSCTHHEVPHDRFDQSRNFYFKLNEPARYEYQSLHLELLRLFLANARQNH